MGVSRSPSKPDVTSTTQVQSAYWSVPCKTSFQAAFIRFRRALTADPLDHRSRAGLADVLTGLRLHERALAQRRTILHQRPSDPRAAEAVAWSAIQYGSLDAALGMCRELIARRVASVELHSAYLATLLHAPGQTGAMLLEAHQVWAEMHGGPFVPAQEIDRFHDHDRAPERQMRIGYLSGEFWLAPSYYFLEPLLRNHDRSQVVPVFYDKLGKHDRVTEVYESLASVFRRVSALTDSQLAAQVQQDRIDILVDLSGHYHGAVLKPLTQRLAPVQVTYPNYPCTTGLRSVDYIITDRWVCPAGSEEQYTERVCRLPSGYLTYAPPVGSPAVAPLPARANGFVTFGVFQRPAKFNPAFWETVAEVLNRVAGSQLLLHFASADLEDPRSLLRRSILQRLAQSGLGPGRVAFRGALPHGEHLAQVSQVDIALDTFPYNGQTTTLESLWMGVPSVTCLGETLVSRVGWQILDRLGLRNLVARDHAAYIEIACRMAADLDELSRLRMSLRETLRHSPMFNAIRITRELESAYRVMWRDWCTSSASGL